MRGLLGKVSPKECHLIACEILPDDVLRNGYVVECRHCSLSPLSDLRARAVDFLCNHREQIWVCLRIRYPLGNEAKFGAMGPRFRRHECLVGTTLRIGSINELLQASGRARRIKPEHDLGRYFCG